MAQRWNKKAHRDGVKAHGSAQVWDPGPGSVSSGNSNPHTRPKGSEEHCCYFLELTCTAVNCSEFTIEQLASPVGGSGFAEPECSAHFCDN